MTDKIGIPVLYEAYDTDMNTVWNAWRKENEHRRMGSAEEALIYWLWTSDHIRLVIEYKSVRDGLR